MECKMISTASDGSERVFVCVPVSVWVLLLFMSVPVPVLSLYCVGGSAGQCSGSTSGTFLSHRHARSPCSRLALHVCAVCGGQCALCGVRWAVGGVRAAASSA
eukprot:3153973-Rhodomonas_salina.1